MKTIPLCYQDIYIPLDFIIKSNCGCSFLIEIAIYLQTMLAAEWVCIAILLLNCVLCSKLNLLTERGLKSVKFCWYNNFDRWNMCFR